MKHAVLMVSIVMVLLLGALGAQAGPDKPDYLGRFAMDDTLTWQWVVAADDPLYPPQFSFYRLDEDEWSGLFHGPFDQIGPDLYGFEIGLTPFLRFEDGQKYAICGETMVAGEMAYAFWTFAIGGRGHKPVKVDVTACP